MASQPGDDLGVLVGRVVIEDPVHGRAGRDGFLDGVEEADELLMAMALHATADDLAIQHVEGGEQGRRAVALVVVRHGADPAFFQRQSRLRSVESLDLAFLVDRQHDGMGRRIDVKPDDVADLGGEGWIVGELEGPDAVRLQPVQVPDALDIREAHACRLRHGPPGPLGRLTRWRGQRQGDDPLAHFGSERRDARGTCFVAQEPVFAFLSEALLPAPDGGLALAGLAHDRVRAEPVSRGEHDPSAPDMFLRAVAVSHDGFEPGTVRSVYLDDDPRAHAPDSHTITATEIPWGTLPSPSIH